MFNKKSTWFKVNKIPLYDQSYRDYLYTWESAAPKDGSLGSFI